MHRYMAYYDKYRRITLSFISHHRGVKFAIVDGAVQQMRNTMFVDKIILTASMV